MGVGLAELAAEVAVQGQGQGLGVASLITGTPGRFLIRLAGGVQRPFGHGQDPADLAAYELLEVLLAQVGKVHAQ